MLRRALADQLLSVLCLSRSNRGVKVRKLFPLPIFPARFLLFVQIVSKMPKAEKADKQARDALRSFVTRANGIFRKASDLADKDALVQASIVLERRGQEPLVFTTQEDGVSSILQSFVCCNRPAKGLYSLTLLGQPARRPRSETSRRLSNRTRSTQERKGSIHWVNFRHRHSSINARDVPGKLVPPG